MAASAEWLRHRADPIIAEQAITMKEQLATSVSTP
jgi:hypothetical protein